MLKQRFQIAPDYSTSRILKGHWQLSAGHLSDQGSAVDRKEAIAHMHAFVEAGITNFDVADIYTGAEELIGAFLQDAPSVPVYVHTKYVPDAAALADITLDQTTAIIDRSLKRLGVERLDLVQFHWWDYAIPRFVDVALHLQTLKEQGKIHHIGVTNFDASNLAKIVEAGVDVRTAQVQYSMLDRRPEKEFTQFCADNGISLLCYGSLAGGFIGESWLGQPEPSPDQLANRSLTKYGLIIQEIGGWKRFQHMLQETAGIAQQHGVTVSEIAISYVLAKQQVAGVIVGSHNMKHLERLRGMQNLQLTADDFQKIDAVVRTIGEVPGNVYDLERNDARHRGIMRTNLNTAPHKG